MKRKTIITVLVSCCCALLLSSLVKAGEPAFPQKAIEMTVGFAPGAGTDLLTRIIADYTKKELGQDVIVTNKPGGSGRAAATLLLREKPDGYKLVVMTDGPLTVTPNFESVPYKPLEDFTFITQIGILETGIMVPADSPFLTLKDMLQFAKANPGKLTIATLGPGTVGQTSVEALASLEKVKIKMVPFSGAAPGIMAVLGKHVMAGSFGSSGYLPHLKAGNVRLLTLLTDTRNEDYPTVPTLKDLGYPLVFSAFYIIVGPKGMEKSVVDKLVVTFRKAMQSSPYTKLADDLTVSIKNLVSGDALRQKIIQNNAANAEIAKMIQMGEKK